MFRLKDIGDFPTVPTEAERILADDIDALTNHLQSGWDINAPLVLSEHTTLRPLCLALVMERPQAIRWLVDNGADLNDADGPAFVVAARYNDESTLRYIATVGADVNARNSAGGEAYSAALHGNNLRVLPVIDSLGHKASKHGGHAFLDAVYNNNRPAIQFFIDHGVDIHFRGASMVFPYRPTALCVAARTGDLEMVQFLVDNGADPAIGERGGERPHTIAVKRGAEDIAAYLSRFEPRNI